MSNSLDAFDAVLLVGGGGTRLGGVDKAAVDLEGRTLVSSALDAANDARTLVVVGETAAPLPGNAIRITEDPPGSGPAAALVAGARAIREPSPWTVLLACDLPGAARALPQTLAARDRDGAVLVDPDEYPQWLLGAYRTQALHAAIDRFGDPTDRSLKALLGDLDLVRIEPIGEDWHDVDTWANHETWRTRLRRRTAYPASPHRSGDQMTDLQHPDPTWAQFVDQACAALDVDPSYVDITTIHDLAREVAHNVDRPLAPVSTFILGLAIGARAERGEQITPADRDALVARIPLSD